MFSYFKSSIQVSSLSLTNLIVSVLKMKKCLFDANEKTNEKPLVEIMISALDNYFRWKCLKHSITYLLHVFISVCFTQNLTMRKSTVKWNYFQFNVKPFSYFRTRKLVTARRVSSSSPPKCWPFLTSSWRSTSTPPSSSTPTGRPSKTRSPFCAKKSRSRSTSKTRRTWSRWSSLASAPSSSQG